MKLFALSVLLFTSVHVWGANLNSSFPCSPQSVSVEIDIYNTDDLFFTGHRLVRENRLYEAINCLNRAKELGPGYLDVRLELIHAFARLSDKKSAQLEMIELASFQMSGYYLELLANYRNRVDAISSVNKPHPEFSFRSVEASDKGHHLRMLVKNEPVSRKELLQTAVALKNKGKFSEAQEMIILALKENPLSPTVHFYAALIAYVNYNYTLTRELLLKTMQLTVMEADILLVMGRALNADGAYRESLKVLETGKELFQDYGCYQFGEALYRAHQGLEQSSKAERIHRMLMDSLSNKNNPELCGKLRNSPIY